MKYQNIRNMPRFIASRWSGNNNMIFPDIVEVGATSVTYFKGTVVGYCKMIVSHAQIASVYIGSGLFFADVILTTTGGDELRARGFRKRDARTIMELLT